jgi:hypothetical protein
MAKSDRHRHRLRVPSRRELLRVADDVDEQIVDVEFVEHQEDECASPFEAGEAPGEFPQGRNSRICAPVGQVGDDLAAFVRAILRRLIEIV